MGALRQILLRHRRLAWLLIALALAIKALIPAGYMIGAAGEQVLTVSICADASGAQLTRQIVVPHHDTTDDGGQHAKGIACPFSALSMSGTEGAGPVLLAIALAFILAIGLAPLVIPAPAARTHLRPPLRGPPVPA